MFEEEKQFSEGQFRAIREIGDSQAGKWLSAYIKQEVERAVLKAMDFTDATDGPSIAYAQAYKRVGTLIWSLLNGDIEIILTEHNIQPEEEEEEK